MVKKIKACIFISGNGSNLKSIVKNSRAYNFKMNDKWHETDFLNVFLIEKFLKV